MAVPQFLSVLRLQKIYAKNIENYSSNYFKFFTNCVGFFDGDLEEVEGAQ